MKEQVAFRIDEELAERLRNMVNHHRGAPLFLTLDGFVETELNASVGELETKYNKGKPYGPAKPKAR